MNNEKIQDSIEVPTTNVAEQVETEIIMGNDNMFHMFFYMAVDEVGKDGFLVRKIYDFNNPIHVEKVLEIAKELNFSHIQKDMEFFPWKYGMEPRGPLNLQASIADHVLGNIKHSNSPYISASSKFPNGAGGISGTPIYLDINKMNKAGIKIISSAEIIEILKQHKLEHPQNSFRVDKLINAIEKFEGEVLIEGNRVPPEAIFRDNDLKLIKNGQKIGRAVQFFAIASTTYELTMATKESIKIKSIKPIAAESIRQFGGWTGCWLGFKLGMVIGGAAGSPTGSGAFLSAGFGSIVFGIGGYFGADFVADIIYEN